MLGFSVDVEHDGNVLVFRVGGRFDAISAPSFEKQIVAQIDNGVLFILIDCSKIEYLSSAGMRLLLSITKKINLHHGKLCLCSVNDEVMNIIRMAGLERVFEIRVTEADAFQYLRD